MIKVRRQQYIFMGKQVQIYMDNGGGVYFDAWDLSLLLGLELNALDAMEIKLQVITGSLYIIVSGISEERFINMYYALGSLATDKYLLFKEWFYGVVAPGMRIIPGATYTLISDSASEALREKVEVLRERLKLAEERVAAERTAIKEKNRLIEEVRAENNRLRKVIRGLEDNLEEF